MQERTVDWKMRTHTIDMGHSIDLSDLIEMTP